MSSCATRTKCGAYFIHAQWEDCLHHATWYCSCNDVMRALHGACMQASRPPYVYVVHQDLLMDVPFAQAEQYL